MKHWRSAESKFWWTIYYRWIKKLHYDLPVKILAMTWLTATQLFGCAISCTSLRSSVSRNVLSSNAVWRRPAWVCMHAHRYTHACTHTHTHMHAHRHTHACTQTHTCMHTDTHMHAHRYTHACTETHDLHRHTHAFAQTHTCMHTDMHMHAHRHTCMSTDTHAWAQTHTCMHTDTHACAQMDIPAHSEKNIAFGCWDSFKGFLHYCGNATFFFFWWRWPLLWKLLSVKLKW